MSRPRMLLVLIACALAAAAALLALAWDVLRHGHTRRAWNIAIALDQAANAMLGGWPDETLSARAWRLRAEARWARWVRRIDRLFGDPTHCQDGYVSERKRMQIAPEYRA